MKDAHVIPTAKPIDTPPQSQTSSPLRILVVEDDADIRNLNTDVLKRSGYEVDIAEDGAAAWDALQLLSYDLVVTDNNMPRMTGIELLAKLRSARMVVPAIMVTGTVPTEVFARQPWLQPAAVLLKPYTAAEILQVVKKVLVETGSTVISDPAQEAQNAPLQFKANSPCRILAVDEDKDLRLLYTDALARPGYLIDVAEDGVSAWVALRAARYDLLITEHDMSGLTGIELIRKLRAAHMDLPVVMAAGRLPEFELDRSPALHLAARLEKPFAVEALLETVKSILGKTGSSIEPPGLGSSIQQGQPPANDGPRL